LESRAHALAAGLFIVVMSLCVGAAVWYLSGSSERGRDFVLATTSAVSGLNPQAQVRYRGIRVGKVQDISINPSDPREILVRVNIPERYPVTMATRARLSFLGVTGLALIDIEDDGSDATPLPTGTDGTAARIPLRGSQFDALGTQAADTMQVLREVLLRLNALLDERNVETHLGDAGQSAIRHEPPRCDARGCAGSCPTGAGCIRTFARVAVAAEHRPHQPHSCACRSGQQPERTACARPARTAGVDEAAVRSSGRARARGGTAGDRRHLAQIAVADRRSSAELKRSWGGCWVSSNRRRRCCFSGVKTIARGPVKRASV
jgi:hypothetical protein